MSPPGQRFPWSRATILSSAPDASGVYVIWNENRCVYVGETQDLQRRLMTHLDGDHEGITRAQPTSFSFETVPAGLRGPRQSALIFQLRPICS
jgi:hypothetical protein